MSRKKALMLSAVLFDCLLILTSESPEHWVVISASFGAAATLCMALTERA
jgi:hypothetical protein